MYPIVGFVKKAFRSSCDWVLLLFIHEHVGQLASPSAFYYGLTPILVELMESFLFTFKI